MRIKIDSPPQQAAIYVDTKESGIKGYTPATLQAAARHLHHHPRAARIPAGAEADHASTRSQGFIFTLERQAKPAVLDVRATSSNDAATGAQLFVDGAPVGMVPARVEVPAGKHRIEVKKPGFNDFADSADVAEGEQRQMVIDLQQAVKKGALLVTGDAAGRRRLPRRRAQGLDAGAARATSPRGSTRSRSKRATCRGSRGHRRRQPAAEGDGAAGAGRPGGGLGAHGVRRRPAPRCGSTAR